MFNLTKGQAKAFGNTIVNVIDASEALAARRRTDAMLETLIADIKAIILGGKGDPSGVTDEAVIKELGKAKERQKKARQKAKEAAEAEAEGRDLETEGKANKLHKALKWAIMEGIDLEAAIETAKLEVEAEKAETEANAEKVKAAKE